MLKALLTLLGALALLGFVPRASAAEYRMPPECVKPSEISAILDAMEEHKEDPTQYECTDDSGKKWVVTRKNISWAITKIDNYSNFTTTYIWNPEACNAPMLAPAWVNDDEYFLVKDWSGEVDPKYVFYYGVKAWFHACYNGAKNGAYDVISYGYNAGQSPTNYEATTGRPDVASELRTTAHGIMDNVWKACYINIARLYKCQRVVNRYFGEQLILAVTDNMGADIDGYTTPTPTPAPGDTSTNPTSGSGSQCTKSDGNMSSNPYDCAPTDSELKCSIIDIPCNLRKLFIPSSDFWGKLFSANNITHQLQLPVVVDNVWHIKLFGKDGEFDWTTITIPEPVKAMVLAAIYWRQGAWIMAYLGLPLPFGSPHGGGGAISEGIEGISGRAEFQSLRRRVMAGAGRRRR